VPGVSTGDANDVTAETANTYGTVETQGLPTDYGFEIGAEADVYGPAAGHGTISSGFGEVTVTPAAQNLAPGTTHHYRLSASNIDGASVGEGRTLSRLARSRARSSSLSQHR
jgi:phosphodiesterase/alkaline phosphatase D-like protein